MNFRPPPVMIKKFVAEEDGEGILRAESELELSLRAGLPMLTLAWWDRPSFNDLRNGGSGIEIPPGPERTLIFTYLGTRHARMGVYLYAQINLFDKTHLSTHAHELSFVRQMLEHGADTTGLIVVGQTNPDLRSFGVISGRRSDVFAFALGYTSGLDNKFIEPGYEFSVVKFPLIEVAGIARRAFACDEVVSVSGWGRARFLRQCFREISSIMSRREFLDQYHASGVRWRPRLPFTREI